MISNKTTHIVSFISSTTRHCLTKKWAATAVVVVGRSLGKLRSFLAPSYNKREGEPRSHGEGGTASCSAGLPLSPPGSRYLFSRISESEAINLRSAASVERVRATSGCVASPTSLCS